MADAAMNTFFGEDPAGDRHHGRGWHVKRRAPFLAALAAVVMVTTTNCVPAPAQLPTAAAAQNRTVPSAAAPGEEQAAPPTLPPPATEKAAPPVAAENAATPTSPPAAPEKAAPPTLPPAPRSSAPAAPIERGRGTDVIKLEGEINGIIRANSQYQLGVALIDTADGAVYQYGVREKFVAASTGKILAAAAYYHFAETGELSLTAPLGRSTAALQIQQMIQQSNNESWALIVGAIGYQRIHDYAASIGIAYNRSYNTLSPAETARTLALLYTGELISRAHTAQLLSYMQHTNYETLIPAAVPPGITVFHKYGLLNGNLHDASILVRNGHAYVFVVYTLGAGLADLPARAVVIHKLTRAVVSGLF